MGYSCKRRLICLLFGIIFLFPVVIPGRVTAQESIKGVEIEVVRVGLESCEAVYMDHLGDTDGYFNKYLSQIYRQIDAQKQYIFQYATGTIEQMSDMLRRGEVDIVIGETVWQPVDGEKLTPREEILEGLSAVDGELTVDRKVLYIKEDNNETGYQDYAGFEGMKVGIRPIGNMRELVEAYCKRKGISFRIVEFTDEESLYAALDSGKINAAVQNIYDPLFRKIADYVGYSNKRILVDAENHGLLKRLNNAVEMLYIEEPNLRNRLEAAFDDTKSYRVFSKRQKEFIQNSGVIKVVSQKNQIPTEYYDKASGTYKGIYVDVLNHVAENTGLVFEFIGADTYAEGLKMVQQGDADLLLSTYDLQEIRKGNRLLFTEPYMRTNLYMVGRYDRIWKDNIRYGLSKQGEIPALVEYFQKQYPEWTKVSMESKDDSIEAAVEKEIDFSILNEQATHYLLSQYTDDNIGVLGAAATDIGICFAVSPATEVDHLLLYEVLNQSIHEMREEDFDTINLVNSIAVSKKMTIGEFIEENFIYFLLLLLFAVSVPVMIVIRNRVRNTARIYQEFLFHIISENVKSVVLIYNNRKQKMEYVFDNMYWILGVSPKECLKNPNILFRCMNEELMDGRSIEFEQMIAGEGYLKELQYENPKTYEKSWIEIMIKAKTDSKGTERYIISITDLTNERNSKLLLSNALSAAEQANLAKTEFLSHISHEIRTPMNAVIGMTTIAKKHLEEPDRVKDCLSKISISSKHLLNLINDILDMSKIDSGKMVLAQDPFAVSDLIENVVTIIMPQMKAKNIDFSVDIISLEHENLVGDMLRLEQVMMNLLSNAVKFTPPHGEVALLFEESAICEKGSMILEITIRDNGIGMSEEFLKRLFEPFEQENRKTVLMNKGTGLGMSITRNIISMMGGNIEVDSRLDKGSTFKVKLLLQIDEAYQGPETDSQLKNLHILIVDDERDVCENTSILLEKMGMIGEWVLSGREAVEKVVEARQNGEDYRAVIIDWKMPEMDGVRTAREIRARVGNEVPIIILSAYDWSEIEEDAYAAGVNAFISKPMFGSKLYYTLLNVIQGTNEGSSFAMKPSDDYEGRNFLLAEDNELNQEIAAGILRELSANVELANNGREAVEKFTASPEGYYDLIFMDIQMPFMDGYKATETIRKLDRADAESVPIVAMTANAFSSDITESFRSGMTGHLSKPIDIDALYDTIRKQLGA